MFQLTFMITPFLEPVKQQKMGKVVCIVETTSVVDSED